MKRKLVKCSPWTYSELIRSDIPRPYGAKSSRPSTLRPSQSSVMKPSREELQARVKFLVKKKRSVKHKVPTAREQLCGSRQGPEVRGVLLAIVYSGARVNGTILGKRSHTSLCG